MLNKIIEDSFLTSGVTQIIGTPKSGKTTLLYHFCNNLAKNKNALILDCENNFNATRLHEITKFNNEKLEKITIVKLMDFFQQHNIIMKLHSFLEGVEIGLIGINGLTTHYRTLVNNDLKHKYKHLLAMELAFIVHLSREYTLPIIFTNQIISRKSQLYEQELKDGIMANVINKYVTSNIILQSVSTNLWKFSHKDCSQLYSITKEGFLLVNG